MHTTPPRGRTVVPAALAALAEDPHDPGFDGARRTRLLLTVWAGSAGLWRAQVESLGGAIHVFESPFELARFLAQLADVRLPPAEPIAGGGLR